MLLVVPLLLIKSSDGSNLSGGCTAWYHLPTLPASVHFARAKTDYAGCKIDHYNINIQLPNIGRGDQPFPGYQATMDSDPMSQPKPAAAPPDDQEPTQLHQQQINPTQMQAPTAVSQHMDMAAHNTMSDAAAAAANFQPASSPSGQAGQALLQRLMVNPGAEAGEAPALHVQLPKAPDLVSDSDTSQAEAMAAAAAAGGAQQHMMDPMMFQQMQMMHHAQLQEAARAQEQAATGGALGPDGADGMSLGDVQGRQCKPWAEDIPHAMKQTNREAFRVWQPQEGC